MFDSKEKLSFELFLGFLFFLATTFLLANKASCSSNSFSMQPKHSFNWLNVFFSIKLLIIKLGCFLQSKYRVTNRREVFEEHFVMQNLQLTVKQSQYIMPVEYDCDWITNFFSGSFKINFCSSKLRGLPKVPKSIENSSCRDSTELTGFHSLHLISLYLHNLQNFFENSSFSNKQLNKVSTSRLNTRLSNSLPW